MHKKRVSPFSQDRKTHLVSFLQMIVVLIAPVPAIFLAVHFHAQWMLWIIGAMASGLAIAVGLMGKTPPPRPAERNADMRHLLMLAVGFVAAGLPGFALAQEVQDKVLQDLIAAAVDRARNEEGRDAPVPAKNEVAMSPRMKIIATTTNGTITITSGKGLQRSYTWDGATRSVEMWPRTERWYGSLGIYFPGPGDHWKEHNGITRGVVSEEQLHFKTLEEANQWIGTPKYMPVVHRNDGLVVGWEKNLPRKQLTVEVVQIYIDGKKPTKLPDSQDDKIVVEQTKEERPKDD
jgi:hypothetical protein